MSYVVLARKYRPQSFTDLVGQEHVARTLAGAIEQGRVAHAFLFTGVRGVGKTTSARLLAKCLNCLGANGDATGPTATPCQTCAACTEIAQGTDLDVQEIDGASYNGVDEVRKLQEGLPFRPARDRYKIYIVDEVHMLSQAAWNAFLKTLEEPPPHVKFIFATTEVHKVPVTILSRCQRYDFKLISADVIAKRLEEVLALEQLQAEPGALMLLARQADGSMRDAMSLLDRVIAFCGEQLREDDVARVLGVASKRVQLRLAREVLTGNPTEVLQVVREICEEGVDLVHFAREFAGVLRDVVAVAVAAGTPETTLRELVFAPEQELIELQALTREDDGAPRKVDDLLRVFHAFSRGFDEMLKNGDVRAQIEMTLVRLARRPPLLPLDDLLGRIANLEKRLATGAPAPRNAPPRGGGGGASGTRPSAPVLRLPQKPTRIDTGPQVRGTLALAPSLEDEFRIEAVPESSPSEVRSLREPETPAVVLSLAAEPIEPDTAHLDLEGFRQILAALPIEHMPLASFLQHAWIVELSAKKIALAFAATSFYVVQLRETSVTPFLEAARRHYGVEVEVIIDTERGEHSTLPTLAQLDEIAKHKAQRAARAAVENHPLVQSARRILGAELREVKIPE